jgi:diguanylate cyclase (GGDEF)-like protein
MTSPVAALGGDTVAVLFIDLDRLKPRNDTYGHEAGDSAILVTAQALLEATPSCDVVGTTTASPCAASVSRCRPAWGSP